MTHSTAEFDVGQLIQHSLFDHRGVIVGPTFSLTDEWYDMVARSRPPKDRPWYHVLPLLGPFLGDRYAEKSQVH